MPLPKNTVHHGCGLLNEEGLAEEWVQLEKQLGFRPAVSLVGAVTDQRKVLEDGCAARDKVCLTKELAEGVLTRDTTVPSEDGYAIPVRVYHSKKTDTSSGRPGVVYIHGDGWTLGSVQADELFARKLALDADHVVVNVEYRLAPECAYPIAGNDCYTVFLWAVKNAVSLGIDPRKVYVTGNSAGGHLSAVVALKVAQSSNPNVLAAQILRIPCTCHPKEFPGVVPNREKVPVYNDYSATAMFSEYVKDAADQTKPLVSPLLAPDELLKKLPPTYIDVCTEDPLYDGGVAYAKKLEDLGVPVKLFILQGMPHGQVISW